MTVLHTWICTLTDEIDRLHILYDIPMKTNYPFATMSVSTSQCQSPASKVIIHLITSIQKSSFHSVYILTTILLTLHFLHANYVTKYRTSYTQISLPTSCTMFLTFITQSSYMIWPYILAIFRELQVWFMCTAYVATCTIIYDKLPYMLYTMNKPVTPWRWSGYIAETCKSFILYI